MRRGLPFWLKLLGAFLAVIVVAVGGVAILANRSARSEFGNYLAQGRIFQAQALAPTFADYYQKQGSWQDVDELVNSGTLPIMPGGERGMGAGRQHGPPSIAMGMQMWRIVVADSTGQVVADSGGSLLGKQLGAGDIKQAASIKVNGEVQGYLLVGAFQNQTDPLEADFLHNLNQMLLLSALAAGGAALVLAVLLSRGLTGPLRALAAAAGQLAAGKRGLRVETDGRGEIGVLGQSFNAMAESLESQEALRRQLIADIAHELRTPLAVIRGNLEALLDGIYKPSTETIAPIHEETLLLARLVDELRDLSLAEAGQLPLHTEPTNPADLARGVLSGLAAQANERAIQLELSLPARQLPLVEVDPGRIRQVLGNLLSNALRYTPQRGRIEVALQAGPGEWVTVRVSDNGPGISAEDLPHVFDRFYRGDRSRARDSGGAGLGLAIARQWVQAHGGSIQVESTPGQGATFTFTLPVSK